MCMISIDYVIFK